MLVPPSRVSKPSRKMPKTACGASDAGFWLQDNDDAAVVDVVLFSFLLFLSFLSTVLRCFTLLWQCSHFHNGDV